jgi:hypothetical protein
VVVPNGVPRLEKNISLLNWLINMEENIFKGAVFGKMFVCRDGQKAMFSGIENEIALLYHPDGTIHQYRPDGHELDEDDDMPSDIIRPAGELDGLQVFKNKTKNIICLKFGWIAVDIPEWWNITEAKPRGISTRGYLSYYDIELNGETILHIYRCNHEPGGLLPNDFRPFYWERNPF